MDGNQTGNEREVPEPANHGAAATSTPSLPENDAPKPAEQAPAADKPPDQTEQQTDARGDHAPAADASESPDNTTPGVLDEAETSDADWAQRNEQLRRLGDTFLRSLGADLEFFTQQVRSGMAGTVGGTGNKAAIGHGAVSTEHLHLWGSGPGRPPVVRGSTLDPVWLSKRVDRYVDNGQTTQLTTCLADNGVTYISGADGTGRRLAAYNALATLCGTDKVRSILLDQDADLTAILDGENVLCRGNGHVVELDAEQAEIRQATLTTLASKLASDTAYLVIIGPPLASASPLRAYDLPHQAPDPTNVLFRHLTCELAIPDNESPGYAAELDYRDTCLADDTIQAYLAQRPRPVEVAELAKRLVEIRNRGGAPAAAVSLLPNALREQARARLQHDPKEDDFTALRRLSAGIAHATYTGSPHGVVRDVATVLFDVLMPEQDRTRSQQRHAQLDSGMPGLVAPAGEPDTPDSDPADGVRTPRPTDPQFAAAVLDVVWHDYDLRQPMLDCLFRLGGDHREQVRMRAGQLAGQLATYDFGYVYRKLLRPLAESPRATRRQTAAWAVERALLDPKVTGRARRQVRDWVLSPNPYLNDAAAQTLATPHGCALIEELWIYLWLIAIRETQVGSSAVAQAVAQFCQPDQPESVRFVLGELTSWVAGNDRAAWVRVQAGRALIFLAHETAPGPHDSWPALLHTANQDQHVWDQLTALWRIALTERVITYRAWDVLHTWLKQADSQRELGEVTKRFVIAMLRDQPFHSRAKFYLEVWQSGDPDSSIFGNILSEI